MRRHYVAFALAGIFFSISTFTYAQDPLEESRIKGLSGLHSVALVFRPNDDAKVTNTKELGDFIRVALARDIKSLKIADSASAASSWLLLTYIITDHGASIRLSAFRWVTLNEAPRSEFAAETWSDQRLLVGGGKLEMSDITETLQKLLTSFAADYNRANQ